MMEAPHHEKHDPKQEVSFSRALKLFLGHLAAAGKANHTLQSYQLDLQSFDHFLQSQYGKNLPNLKQLPPSDFAAFRQALIAQGLKTNTRRRKLLTLTQFLKYIALRLEGAPELAQKRAVPYKLERVPFTVPLPPLIAQLTGLPTASLLENRNRLLLWTMAESGCLVSELPEVRFQDWSLDATGQWNLHFAGKNLRNVAVSQPLSRAVREFEATARDASWIFFGFNRFGSLGSPISVRGIELMVRHYSLVLNIPQLTARTIRHSVILHWLQEGVPEKEIMQRLGLKSTYAFRSYQSLLSKPEAAPDSSEAATLDLL